MLQGEICNAVVWRIALPGWAIWLLAKGVPPRWILPSKQVRA